MKNAEFEEKLSMLYQTLFDEELKENNGENKSWLNSITSFVYASTAEDFPFFLLVEEVGDTVEFIINVRNADLFRAKKEQLNNLEEDFIPQIKVKGRWESYDFDFSTLLLTEYVDWLWERASDRLEMQVWGYALYVPIKQYWTPFFNPFSYPNKIWLGKEMRSVILIQNESNLLKCLARDRETLDLARNILEIKGTFPA